MESHGQQNYGKVVQKDVKEISEKEVMCPVCGKLLGKRNLPDAHAAIEDGLYFTGDVCIVNSQVTLHYDFVHYIDEEEGISVKEPHHITAVIQAAFDDTGRCATFHLVQILPSTR